LGFKGSKPLTIPGAHKYHEIHPHVQNHQKLINGKTTGLKKVPHRNINPHFPRSLLFIPCKKCTTHIPNDIAIPAKPGPAVEENIANLKDALQKIENSLLVNLDIPIDTKRLVRIKVPI